MFSLRRRGQKRGTPKKASASRNSIPVRPGGLFDPGLVTYHTLTSRARSKNGTNLGEGEILRRRSFGATGPTLISDTPNGAESLRGGRKTRERGGKGQEDAPENASGKGLKKGVRFGLLWQSFAVRGDLKITPK